LSPFTSAIDIASAADFRQRKATSGGSAALKAAKTKARGTNCGYLGRASRRPAIARTAGRILKRRR